MAGVQPKRKFDKKENIMHSASSQHGYTLLQMLVAVMVMSIMVAMGVIMYQYYVQQARVKAV